MDTSDVYTQVFQSLMPLIQIAIVLWAAETILTMLIKEHRKSKKKKEREKRRPVKSSRGIDRCNHPLNLRSNELDEPAVQAMYSEIIVFFILLPLNPYLDSEAGEGIWHRSMRVVPPSVAHFFGSIG